MDKRTKAKKRNEDARRFSVYNRIVEDEKDKFPEAQSYRERMHRIAMYIPAAVTYGRRSE